jgi:TPR repeat protein
VIRNLPPLAVEGVDPWDKIQIDPATRQLAERAAAVAGLAVEEWLERAIRRACPSAFGTPSATNTTAPHAQSLPIAALAQPAEIEASLAALLAMARQQTIAQRAEILGPLNEQPSDNRERQEEDDRAAPRTVVEREQDEPRGDASKKRFKLWGARDAKAETDVEPAHVRPPAQRSAKRTIFIAVGIAVAVTAGAVTAQYLIPDPSRVPSFSNPAPIEPSRPSSDAANNASSVPLADSPSLPSTSPASTSPADALPASTSGPDPSTASDLPPVPDSPTLAPNPASIDTAAGDLAFPTPSASAEATAAPPLAAEPDTSASITAAKPTPAAAPTKAASAPSRAGKPDDVAPTDPKALAPWLEQRARAGDPIAQYRLGTLYALGQGVQQDYQHAAQLFKTSADGGVAEAQYDIAVMYGEGLGIGRDPNVAVEWYQKAAAQGNANAAFNLGVAYSNGVGVQQNMDQAAQWFGRAAAAGIVNAQFNLGLLYERGDGVPVSPLEAYAWYNAAAAQGDSGAGQRRDRLARTLSPSTLQEAQTRAQQVAATIQSGNTASGGRAAKAAALKP